MSRFTTLVLKSSLNYASEMHFITLFDNQGNLDSPKSFNP
jgi:hypothetical protein